MELEELKTAWESLDKKVARQETLTNQMIEQMTQHRYHSKINKIAYPEIIGSIVLFAAAVLLLLNFSKFNTGWMQLFGALSILFMLLLPILSLNSIKGLKHLNIASLTHSEVLYAYSRQMIRFQRIQQLSFYCTFAFMLVFFPVVLNLMGKDISQLPAYFWYAIVPLGVLLFFIAARWVLKSYSNILRGAQNLLKEVQELA